jgi:plastocyanin
MKSILAAMTWAAALAAQAGTLTVTVTDKDGQPASDVAVLVRYLLQPARSPAPTASATIGQERLRFQPFLSIVNPGATLRFVNRDSFDHHIKGDPVPSLSGAPGTVGAKNFEVRIGPSGGKPLDLSPEGRGLYALGCHLHSTMRGYVLITDTPWFGKTDAGGLLKLEQLPDGVIDVTVVHPEQFAEVPPQRLTLSGDAAVELKSQLGFTPRRRRL